MKTRLLFSFGLAASLLSAFAQTPDPGWPRVFKAKGKELTVYQPQVDYWNGYTNIHFRCAIAVKGATKQEKFGVTEVDAVTVTDHDARIVALVPTQRDIRFPNTSDSELASLHRAVDELHPPGRAITLSLDRALAYLDANKHPEQKEIKVSLDPPKIFYSRKPAVLVMFIGGEPEFKPVETNKTDLLFAFNTNWDLFFDTIGQRYYLLNGENWLSAQEVSGPWSPAKGLPAAFSTLPNNDNWTDVRMNIPGKRAKEAPVVFISTQPAEMIVTEGEPSYRPIRGTRLMSVANTDSTAFLHSGEGKFYLLVAGRWFRAATLEGPWSVASKDLPADFVNIPDSDPAAFVKASVPGTREARDAVLMASVPTTTTVVITNVTEKVVYTGAPQFMVIDGTTVQYAVNTPNSVFLVSGGYYWCNQGAWLCGGSASGPWTFCTSVPSAIYTIPATHPTYNVTYVVVQSSTPTTVVYSQTSGYSGQYVAATGVLMFGMGILVGAAIANNNDYYHYHYHSCYYSYGCGAVYHHGHGGYYASAHHYGPYGGAGRTAAYNPYTGTYSRGAYAYGPAGSASVRQAYNPYTGGYAQSARVDTAHRSAGRFYAEQGGKSAWGGYRSTSQGTVAGARTSEGAGFAAWDTKYSQGAVAKGKNGNVYAGKDGTVYKKDSSGGWSSNSGGGWEDVNKPQPGSRSATSTSSSSGSRAQPSATASTRAQPSPSASTYSRESTQSLNSQASARQWGSQQSQRASASQSPGSRWSGGSRSSSSSSSRGGRGR